MSRLRLQRLAIGLLAFLAIGWAQTFGLHRGWLCERGGVEHITQVDHCHGPASHACHENEDDDDHSTPHHHEEGDNDTHQHVRVTESLVAKQQNDAALSISAPVKLITVYDLWVNFRPQVPGSVCFAVETPPARGRPSQEWPHRLAQVIALRI